MLDEIVQAATNLPVIVQGAFGSGLCALVIVVGRRVVAAVSSRVAKTSLARRKAFLTEEILKYRVLATPAVANKGAFVLLLLYRASRSLFKALTWLTLGLLFGTVSVVLSTVGFLGCLYYLFAALNTVSAPGHTEDVQAKLNALTAESESPSDGA